MARSAAAEYIKQLASQFSGYVPNWLPGTPLTLGVIGVKRGKRFVPVADLSSFGLDFAVRRDRSADARLEFRSRGGVTVRFKAAGKTSKALPNVPKGEAGAAITFNRRGATVFSAEGVREHRIKDQVSLGQQVVDLVRNGTLQRRHLIVTHLVAATRCTILVSSESGAKMELGLATDATVAGLEVVSASLSPTVAYERGMATYSVNSTGLTPLFRVMRVSRSILDRITGRPDSARVGSSWGRPAFLEGAASSYGGAPHGDEWGGDTSGYSAGYTPDDVLEMVTDW